MIKSLYLLIALLVTLPVHAWGQIGHRVTGAIAERHLSPETRIAIEAILGTETLAEASTWPDEQRSNPAPFWQSTANPFHYVTVPTGKTYAEVGAPERGDSVTALKRFSATIKDPDASLEEKQLALRFIVHIIGDLHQPLHAGNGHDRGGNTIEVTYFGEETNLHRVWDGHLIDGEKLSFTEMADWLTAKTSPEDAQSWNDANPETWINESAKIRDTIYPQEADLSWDYRYRHIDTVKRRLQMGGVRIASYLNALFAS